MDYILANRLKDAGFPQNVEYDTILFPPGTDAHLIQEMNGGYASEDFERLSVIVPSLESLIEACGDNLEFLSNHSKKGYWLAMRDKHALYKGSTPTEAIARLWLQLQDSTTINK